MTKKELLKLLDEGPVRVKIDGKLRQLTRKAANSDQKAAYKALDEGANIGVWDMGIADITTIQNKDIESVIGHGQNTEASGGSAPEIANTISDFQSADMAGVKNE